MTDSIISVYGSGGYQTFLDAEAVTTTAGQLNALRQRIQISVRDITSGVPTEVGDATNQAIRVNLVAGSVNVSANPNVTVTTLGPNFPVVTVTGNLSVTPTPNVTVTQWTVPQPITISGTVTATGVTIQQATVTQGTTPWTVTYSAGTQVVTFTAPTFFPLPITLSSQWPATTTFLPVTFTNPTVAVSGTPAVTFSSGTQAVTVTQLLVSASQGTAPWVVTGTGTILGLGPSFPTVTITGTVTTTGGAAAGASNVTVTQWTAPQVVSVTGTVTQGTTPWAVTQTSSPWWVAGTIPATLSSLTATPTLFLPTTFTNPTVAISGTPTVTFSGGTQAVTTTQLLVSATQGTNPWVVTYSQGTQVVSLSTAAPWAVTYTQGTQVVSLSTALPWPVTQSGNMWLVSDTQGTNPWVVSFSGTQPVSLSQVVLSSNVAATTPTGPAVQTVPSLAALLVPIYQVVSTTAASATIIPAVSGKRIFVTGYHLVVTPATVVNWEDNAATPNGLTGPMSFAASSGLSAYGSIDNPVFVVVTPGNALRIKQSGAARLGGVVTAYQL